MNKNIITRQLVVVCLILGLTSLGFAVFFTEKTTGEVSVDFSRLPVQIADWTGEGLEVDHRVYEILETTDILVRKYTKPGSLPVNLSIVYAQDNRSAFHPPEICYEGSSYKLMSKTAYSIYLLSRQKEFTVNRLLLSQDDIPRMISCYWFMMGDKPNSNYYSQQMALVMNELSNAKAVGALIQITTAVVNGDEEGANQRIADFVNKGFEPISNMLK